MTAIFEGINETRTIARAITRRTFWARILTGSAGVWLIYIGVLILLASSERVRDTVIGAGKTVATKGLA